jgi:prepilin-type N-terminal cleavage/methylation domain-containing protein
MRVCEATAEVQRKWRRPPRGFSLTELMILVAILGLLTAIALPNLRRAVTRSRVTTFARNVRFCAGAFQLYLTDTGTYPTNTSSGAIPPGMEPYLRNVGWAKPTSIGGHWRWEIDSAGVKAAIAVVGPVLNTAELEELDRMLDNGDLSSGIFRKLDETTYLYVLEE